MKINREWMKAHPHLSVWFKVWGEVTTVVLIAYLIHWLGGLEIDRAILVTLLLQWAMALGIQSRLAFETADLVERMAKDNQGRAYAQGEYNQHNTDVVRRLRQDLDRLQSQVQRDPRNQYDSQNR